MAVEAASDDPLGIRLVSHVADDVGRAFPEDAGRVGERLLSAPRDHHRRAARDELLGRGAAKAGSATGHERHTSVQKPVREHIRSHRRRHRCRWYGGTQNGNQDRTMQIPGVHIETLHNPVRYTYSQIEKACAIAQLLNRGKLVLVEPPRR